VRVRDAIAEDLGEVLRLYRQLQPEDPILTDGRDREVFNEILSSPYLNLLVLDDGAGGLLASCYLNVIPNITRSASPYAIVENVVSEETARGLGHGKRVVMQALDQAWSLGCYKVMLQTGSKQASTHAFYRSCGFSGSDKAGYVARPPGGRNS
jgi:GNAT superfamily N-acetyltransferase